MRNGAYYLCPSTGPFTAVSNLREISRRCTRDGFADAPSAELEREKPTEIATSSIFAPHVLVRYTLCVSLVNCLKAGDDCYRCLPAHAVNVERPGLIQRLSLARRVVRFVYQWLVFDTADYIARLKERLCRAFFTLE